MKNSFHNTTGETGKNLEKYEEKAKSQESKILAYFKAYPGGLFTSEHIFLTLFYDPKYPLKHPISSTRRALSNLRDEGVITKLPEKKIGVLSGRPNHMWELTKKTILF